MAESIVQIESMLRLSLFVGVFILIAVWEVITPCRAQSFSRWRRWPANLAIVAINTLLVRVLLPTTVVGMAFTAQSQGWGMLNQLNLVHWMSVVLCIVLLDLMIYFQHVVLHALPLLWRIHRVHHTDLVFDVTTGARFHPLEILLSLGIKLLVIVALGPPVVAVLVFEVMLNVISMFNHGNIEMPRSVDRVLRWMVVTPDMHRIHHSILRSEINSNFGFNLPWWDRLFGTYVDQPVQGHATMMIGLEEFRSPAELKLGRMLWQPFRNSGDDYAIDRRGESRGEDR